jgi:DNA-binding NtrC family response regulator
VRELMNVVERLAILYSGAAVGAREVGRVLPARGPGGGASPGYLDSDERPLRARLEDYERAIIGGALEASGGSVAEAGRKLQTDRANLYRRMRRLGLRDGDGSRGAAEPPDD